MKYIICTLLMLLFSQAQAELVPLVPDYEEAPIYEPSKLPLTKQTNKSPFTEFKLPLYPREELKRSGKVTFEFVVDEQGKAQNIKTVYATSAAFEKAALEALKQNKIENINKMHKKQKMNLTFLFSTH